MSELNSELDKTIRSKWVVGDLVEVFSKSRDEWFPAKIIEIYDDDDGEWLAVVVENTMIKEVQRFTPDVRPLMSHDDDDSDSAIDSELGSSDDSSSELSSSDDEDEKALQRRQKKMAKNMSKHHETCRVWIDRCGSAQWLGKFVYCTTTEAGFPVFEHVDHKHLRIENNEDEMRWEFIDRHKSHGSKPKVFYYNDTESEFPPSSGWSKTRHADLPAPGVRVDQQKHREVEDNFFEDDPFKFSPFLMTKYKFENFKRDPLGFDLKVLKIHSSFVAVKSIKPNSQAEAFGIQSGDILVSANDVDLSKMQSVKEVSSAIAGVVKSLADDGELTVTFAREKQTFKVLICQRAGTKEVNGKYSIQGMENDALMFANNENKDFKIQRIYVNEEEDEAIWALRKVDIHKDKPSKKSKQSRKRAASTSSQGSSEEENHLDYYIVLASAKDEVPPECAWEAVDPHGLWPAAGLQYYDVKVVPPSKPRIIRCQPNPNAVQIRFECDEAGRRPKVCPHMEVWYEIEMRHFKYNPNKGKTKSKAHDTKIWKTQDSPFVANKLVNGDDYEFVVRSCNHIATTNSESSARVTPLQLPPKPKIIDITGAPGELFVHFHCPNAKDREVQASFEIIVDPPLDLDEAQQDYKVKDRRLLVDNDNKPVRLRHLVNGTKYQIIVASVNSVGVTYSEPETAYPSKEPPLPQLLSVKAGNREITVHFKCDGYDRPDVKAWFEMVITPPPPTIDQAGVYQKNNQKAKPGVGDDEKSNGPPQHFRQRSRMRTKLARKSRWRRQTMSQKLFMGGSPAAAGGHMASYRGLPGISASSPKAGASPQALDEEKSTEQLDAEKAAQMMAIYEDDDFVPYFRRKTRHSGSPVKISPLVNGITYTVQVRAVTLSGSQLSKVSEGVTPKGPPPIPKISKLQPGESSVVIDFVCNDYATAEYKAKFQVESFPQTMAYKGITGSPYTFAGLTNGKNYKFHLRASNKEGKSKWSEMSAQVTPLKIPPTPIELRCVPFDREITVFWVCEELKTPEYSGWYEVESEPKTFTMVVTRQQARFRRLDNGRKYTFRVTAHNQVGKATSAASLPCIPDDDINKEQYGRNKKAMACETKELLLKRRKEERNRRTNKLVQDQERRRKQQEKKDAKANKMQRKKVLKAAQKKEQKERARRRKKEAQQADKKRKMEEQRAKVMQNKRRMSVLAKERINQMDAKMPLRKGGKNANRMDLSAFGKKKKTKKKAKVKSPKDEAKEKEVKKPKQSGTSLLAQDEIERLTRERNSSDAKRRSRKKKKVDGPSGIGSGDEATSPRKSRKKSKNGRKKSTKKKVESQVD